MKTTKAQNPEAATTASSVSDAEVQSVDRIRDIIFGAQMRDYEDRFKRLEERLANNLEQLREQTREQIQSLAERLDHALESEASSRKDSGRKLKEQLNATENALSDKVENLFQQLRQEIEGLGKDFQKRLEQISAAKTDRKALGRLLANVAERLSSDGPSKKKK